MRDVQVEIFARFDSEARGRALALADDTTIAEHAANPHGPHSDKLQRIMKYMRRAPMPGKYIIIAVLPWQDYRIGELTGVRGQIPKIVGDSSFATESAAMHGIFLQRLADMKATAQS